MKRQVDRDKKNKNIKEREKSYIEYKKLSIQEITSMKTSRLVYGPIY